MRRSAGVLLHITSLPGVYGIGGFGKEAEAFAKKLKEAGMAYWQVLPFTNPGSGDSPYQSDSAFAGSPLLIDPEDLYERKLLTKDELEKCKYPGSCYSVDYAWVRENRMQMLKEAFAKADEKIHKEMQKFEKENPWVKDVIVFQAIKETEGQKAWWDWSDKILQKHDAKAVSAFEKENRKLCDFYLFIQFIFYTQWTELKKKINEIGISVIGDIPIYVSGDSCDVWANRSLFQTNKDGSFKSVAGVPPDYFCEDGQLWGNPVYDWAAHEKEDYAWWLSRLHQNFKLYDVIRIDHFRGFSRFYACPADAENARNGKWYPGPGMKLWNKIFDEFGREPAIFAEDLGETDDELIKFLDETGLPTMRVLQFGMVPYDDSKHMPHNYPENCIAYTGTHDNNTLLGWLWEASEEDRKFALDYCRFHGTNWGDGGVHAPACRAMLTTVWSSAAKLAIAPLQDVMGFGSDTRMNAPGMPTGQWRIRFGADSINQMDTKWLAKLNWVYKRF